MKMINKILVMTLKKIDMMFMLVRQGSCAKVPSHKVISSSKFQEEGQGQKDDFEFRVSSFKFQVSNFKFQVSSFKFQVSNFKFQVSREGVRKEDGKPHCPSFKEEGRGRGEI